jgi:DNA processing protein
MQQKELFYTLALLQVEGIGDVTAKKLLSHFTSAEAVFNAKKKEILAIEGIGEFVYRNINNQTTFKLAEQELAFIEKENITTCSFFSEDYPNKLKHCADSPLLLFCAGNINWTQPKTISIVGTRQITPYGATFTKKLIEDLAPLNPTIISGFAYGVDIVAHQAALDYGLQTIGVLAHGLNQIYPKSHKKYMAKMEENGGFVTEFWSMSNPDRENFVKRNRIVAGMSEATVVIESAERSGSLITAKMANDYNRDVFALPGRTTDVYSQGCNTLIKTQQAHVITSAADLVYMLNWDLQDAKKELPVVQKQLFVELDETEKKVYDYLNGKAPELLDIIALDCDIPVFRMSSVLLNMELKGVVRPLPGKAFEVV